MIEDDQIIKKLNYELENKIFKKNKIVIQEFKNQSPYPRFN